MKNQAFAHMLAEINNCAKALDEDALQALLQQIRNARFVLIGEASHGSAEFYQTRIALTKMLIEKKGFMAVAFEGDWPDVYLLNRYVQGVLKASDWQKSFANFSRFPIWMWRNETLPPFIRWLRKHNDDVQANKKVGLFGLDIYSLYHSIQAVINYLAAVDPKAAEQARLRYGCFDDKQDPQNYGYLTTLGVKKSCIDEAVRQFQDMQQHFLAYSKKDGQEDEFFYALQNARVIKNAELYYRSMFADHVSSWNVRDKHMAETLNALADHLEKKFNKPAKIIVWAHNSHVGDARATEMNDRGELNIGQLVREQYPESSYLIGFSTYEGTVTAASDWGETEQIIKVNPGLAGSYEELFHHVKYKNFCLNLHASKKLTDYLNIPHLQRAIGVIYRPETERDSHYYLSKLPLQFDTVIHIDETHAVLTLDLEKQA